MNQDMRDLFKMAGKYWEVNKNSQLNFLKQVFNESSLFRIMFLVERIESISCFYLQNKHYLTEKN